MFEEQNNEDRMRQRRLERIREMQKRKKQQELFRKYSKIAVLAVGAVLIAVVAINKIRPLRVTAEDVNKAAIENESIGTEIIGTQIAEAETIGNQTEAAGNEVAESYNQGNIEGSAEGEAGETTGTSNGTGENAVEGDGTAKNNAAENNVAESSADETSDGQAVSTVASANGEMENEDTGRSTLADSAMQFVETAKGQLPGKSYSARTTASTKTLGEDIVSKHALLIDLESGNILAQKDAMAIINPASMTKVLTVLVAAEQIEEADLDDTFTMTLDITDYSYVNDCSNTGFLENEVITVRDLFYGTILPSGADAAVGLATYVAGSQEAFVELMNAKLKELGLSETAHFTNCVGLYDENHYCSIYDMAIIMEAAMDNDLCKEVMSAHTYTTSATEQHPEGITISNWFLRRIEDKDTGGTVVCGKTGYVVESGNCAVSYGIDHNGKEYICATADSTSNWRCIYDHVALYKEFATGGEAVTSQETGE